MVFVGRDAGKGVIVCQAQQIHRTHHQAVVVFVAEGSWRCSRRRSTLHCLWWWQRSMPQVVRCVAVARRRQTIVGPATEDRSKVRALHVVTPKHRRIVTLIGADAFATATINVAATAPAFAATAVGHCEIWYTVYISFAVSNQSQQAKNPQKAVG